eukprot:548366_1
MESTCNSDSAEFKIDTNNNLFSCGNNTNDKINTNVWSFSANNNSKQNDDAKQSTSTGDIAFSCGKTTTNTNATEKKSNHAFSTGMTGVDDSTVHDSTPIIDWLKDNNLNDIKLKEALIDEEIENIDDLL